MFEENFLARRNPREFESARVMSFVDNKRAAASDEQLCRA